MSKTEAISIVRAKYPRAIVIPDHRGIWSMLVADYLSPRSRMCGTDGTTTDAWVGFADDILKGEDW